jgi:hypothetical protein
VGIALLIVSLLSASAPAPATEPEFAVARVQPGQTVVLRDQPGGQPLGEISARTEFGSPQVLAIVRRRGRWLGVISPALGNGRLAWVDAQQRKVLVARTQTSLEVDLSERELQVRRRGSVVRRFTVDVGAASSPTPTGRFSITDKLPGPSFGAAYGCCILALSGRQPRLPPGWRGGDRLAIHGTPGAVSGRAASGGCLRASIDALHFLMRSVPLGTQVLIHA